MTTPVSSPTTDTTAHPLTMAARPPVPTSIRLRRRLSAVVRYGLLLIVAAVIIVPVGYAVIGGFKDPAQLANDPIGLPNPWVTSNYTDTLTSPSFWRQLVNSTLIAGLSTVLVVLFAAFAAFVFARRAFPGREVLYTLFTLGLLFPAAVAILPLFILVRDLGLLDNPLGIALPEAAFGLPLTIVILRPFFRSIPNELEDAASIDGCGSFGFFWRILLPLSRPVLATVGVLAIVASWNQFLLPLVMLSNESNWTLPLGVTNFSTQYTTDTARILAYTTLALVPALVFYLFAERQLVGGLTQGSVKG
jgi:raffinose/stachyose/melibiose transport system permease protein